jgi:hypothetical protein
VGISIYPIYLGNGPIRIYSYQRRLIKARHARRLCNLIRNSNHFQKDISGYTFGRPRRAGSVQCAAIPPSDSVLKGRESAAIPPCACISPVIYRQRHRHTTVEHPGGCRRPSGRCCILGSMVPGFRRNGDFPRAKLTLPGAAWPPPRRRGPPRDRQALRRQPPCASSSRRCRGARRYARRGARGRGGSVRS